MASTLIIIYLLRQVILEIVLLSKGVSRNPPPYALDFVCWISKENTVT